MKHFSSQNAKFSLGKLACKLKKSYIGLIKNLDLKRAWNKAFLAHQMQIFLKQAIVQLPKIIMYACTLTKIGPEIKHF